MSDNAGNRLYLTCSVCGPDIQHSLMLGLRRGHGYSRTPSANQLQAWFDQHEHCGGVNDKFKLALQKTPNWDAVPKISPDSHVGAHVKTTLALVKPWQQTPDACECGCREFETGGSARCRRCHKPSFPQFATA